LRRDARANVEKLIAAALEVFFARGFSAPMDLIAKTAGVSIGTLYNRFPTREALIDAVVPDMAADAVAEIALKADAEPSAWSRFEVYITGLLEMQDACPALDDIIARRYPGSHELSRMCDAAVRHSSLLMERAQADGTLRTDFQSSDLIAIFLANSGIVRANASLDTDAWRRHIKFVFAGIRVHPRAEMAKAPNESGL
jgi:AcrR family transcriptional regulator